MKTVDELRPHASRALEAAYQAGDRREKCSREDFTAGWLAALEWLHSTSSFLPVDASSTEGGPS